MPDKTHLVFFFEASGVKCHCNAFTATWNDVNVNLKWRLSSFCCTMGRWVVSVTSYLSHCEFKTAKFTRLMYSFRLTSTGENTPCMQVKMKNIINCLIMS